MHSSKQMERGVESYRYSMPLQPPSQQFLDPIREKLDILMQQEALHQALGNPPPFALGPHPYAGEHRQRLITEFAGDLPPCLGSRGGFHIRLGLGNWLGITSWLPDHDLTRCPGRGPYGSVSRDLERLIGMALLLFGIASKRRRRRRRILILAMGLLGLDRGTSTE